jgi:tetratricopeptide (TPR) repeat protein
MAILLHAKSSPGLLARMFGADAISATDINNLRDLGMAFQAGKSEVALALFEQMPKAIQESGAVTAMHIQLLQNGTDEDKYIAALEAATLRFPAPRFRMLMVDAYMLRKRWSDAIRVLDESMTSIERDAVVLMLRASILLMGGDVDEAKKSTSEALALEPDCRSVLIGSLDVHLAAKDWLAVVACIRKLEATDEFDFRGKLVGEIWEEFLKQPESIPWR